MAINCFVPLLLGIINTTVYEHVCGCVQHVASSQDPPVLKHTEHGQTCALQKRKVLKMDRHNDTWKRVRQPSPYIWSLVLRESKQACGGGREACGGRPWGNSWISLSPLQGRSSACQTHLSDEKVNQSVRRY